MSISFCFDSIHIDKQLPKSKDDFLLLRYRIPSVFISFIFIILFSIINVSISTFFSFLFFGMIGIAFSCFYGRIAIKIFTFIYANAAIASIFFYYIFKIQYGIPYGSGGSDSLGYEQLAALLKGGSWKYDSEEIGILIDLPYHNSKGYIYLINLLIRIADYFGGFHTMMPRLLNCSILGICSVVVYSISNKISLTSKQAINSALVTGLFPMMVYVSIQTFRDIPIAFMLLISVSASISIIKTKSALKRLFYTLLFAPIIFIIMELRLLNTINIALIFVVGWFVFIFSVKKLTNLHVSLFIVAIALVYFSLSFIDLPLVIDLVGKLDSSSTDLSEGGDRASAGGLSLILFNLPTPIKIIASIVYSFITPLPILYTKDIDWNFLSIGTIYQFVFIPFIFVGLKNTWRSRLMLPLLAMFLICYVGYVFGSFTFRHITYIVPFAAIYGVIGYDKYKKQRWVICQSMLGILVLLIFSYYLIKL